MKTSTLAWSLAAGLAFTAAPLHAQHVSGEVVVRGGPVAGRVVVHDGYSVVRVERFRHRHGKHWRRNGYREVIVYYIDGRYYDRVGWDHPRLMKSSSTSAMAGSIETIETEATGTTKTTETTDLT